jgi:hypothetical protein
MAKKKIKINSKFLKQGKYSTKDVYENIIRPLLSDAQTLQIGIIKTSCVILKDQLEKSDIDMPFLEEFKNVINHPDVDFALALIKKDKDVAYLFSHLVDYKKENKDIKAQTLEITDLIKEKKRIMGLISG